MNPATARTTDMIGDEFVVSTRALAEILAAALTAKGYAAYDDDYADRTYTYRSGEPVLFRVLHERVRAAVLAILADDENIDDARAARRARTTRRLIQENATGAHAYIAKIATEARDQLPTLTEDEHRALRKASRPAPAKADHNAYAADWRAKQSAAHREDALAVLRRWSATLPEGRHELGAVWTGWRSAVTSSQRVGDQYPGAIAIGRTKFYKLLPEVGAVVNGHARKRYLVIPAHK